MLADRSEELRVTIDAGRSSSEVSIMSKAHHLKWLAIGAAASAIWASSCVVPPGDEDDSANDVVAGEDEVGELAAGDVDVTLSAARSKIGATDAVLVTVTLTSTAKHPVRLLSWYLPDGELEEDLFDVTLNGKAVDFTGPHYKRPAPEDSDYITLAPGERLTRTIDLTSFYDFSQAGDYSVHYSASYLPPGTRAPVSLGSKDTVLSIQPHIILELPNQGGTTSLAFSKCTASQSDTVTQALAAAKTMADGASSYLLSTAPGNTSRFTTWFGAFSSGRWTTATNHYAAIQDALYNKPMTFDCGCKKKYYAYVYPNQPYTVYLCSVFWNAPLSGTDSKGGTIIHETSHFTVVADTDDWAYGQTAAKSLSISDPFKALDNADSHEYFAENTPSLP